MIQVEIFTNKINCFFFVVTTQQANSTQQVSSHTHGNKNTSDDPMSPCKQFL